MNLNKKYNEIYPYVDLAKVLEFYNISFKTHTGGKGVQYTLCCPFHDDHHPSFSFAVSTGLYQCFVCGGGNFFTFIKKMQKFTTMQETIAWIEDQVGISHEKIAEGFSQIEKMQSFNPIPKSQPNLSEEFAVLKEIALPEGCEPAEDYFEAVKKRVSYEMIKKWELKYCPKGKYEGRLIIPVYFNEKLVSFIARDMIGRSEVWKQMYAKAIEKNYTREELNDLERKFGCKKVLFPFGSPNAHIFFNWDKAKAKKEVIVVEGAFDTMRLDEFGYNSLALLSCHLNEYRKNILLQTFDRVFIALDNDKKIEPDGKISNPGQMAARKIFNDLEDIEAYNIVLPEGKDPDDCIKEEFDNAYAEAKNVKEMFDF